MLFSENIIKTPIEIYWTLEGNFIEFNEISQWILENFFKKIFNLIYGMP